MVYSSNATFFSQTAGEVEVEDVLPRLSLLRAGFDLGQVNIAQSKDAQAAEEQSGPVDACKGEGCLALAIERDGTLA